MKLKKAKCKNCNKEYIKLKKPIKNSRLRKNYRRSNSITCSRECSREYQRKGGKDGHRKITRRSKEWNDSQRSK